jgi:LuxR family quorum-sensing transcriptional regulator LasR
MRPFDRFTELLECKTEEEWFSYILQLGSAYGFERTLIALAPGLPTARTDFSMHTDFPSDWIEVYDRKKFFNIDPIIAHCITHSTPLIWSPKIFTSEKQKEMSQDAAHFGLRSGISLPFHGANGEVGVLYFATGNLPSSRACQRILDVTPYLSLMRDYAFQARQKFVAPNINHSAPSLTVRELECLTWCSTGKSSWEIAQIMKCSEPTINFHITNFRKKLHAPSRGQAVINAIHCGLLRRAPKFNLSRLLLETSEGAKEPAP